MNHGDFLLNAAKTAQQPYTKAAEIASTVLGRSVPPYDVAVIMAAVNLVRMSIDPSVADNFYDVINCLAYAGQFAQGQGPPPEPEQHDPMRESIPDKPTGAAVHIKSVAPAANPQTPLPTQPYKFEKPR